MVASRIFASSSALENPEVVRNFPRILISGLPAEQVDEIRRAVPEAEIVTAPHEELIREVVEAEALVGICTRELIRAGHRLRWVQVFDAGIEEYRFPELVENDIVLTNTKTIQAPEVADHAMALLLALTRSLHRAVRNQARRHWAHPPSRPIELRGKTALVIGLGGIGIQIAERAASFGMTVIGIDPGDSPLVNSVRVVYKPDQLDAILGEADVVFMAAPHTVETEGMLGQKQFALMRRNSYLVNVSRGRTVQTDALVQALMEDRFAGVGLDVTDPEPLPDDHPLWSFENVVITPHIAGQSDQNRLRRFELIKDNAVRFVRGLPLRNVVDKLRGY
jgi:phosphoglycerate dehydrogenase-like enzyme